MKLSQVSVFRERLSTLTQVFKIPEKFVSVPKGSTDEAIRHQPEILAPLTPAAQQHKHRNR